MKLKFKLMKTQIRRLLSRCARLAILAQGAVRAAATGDLRLRFPTATTLRSNRACKMLDPHGRKYLPVTEAFLKTCL